MRLSVIRGLTNAAFAKLKTLQLPIALAELLEANVPVAVTSAVGWARVLAFDDTTEEFLTFSFILPADFIENPIFKVPYRTAATSGTFAIKVQVMATSDGDPTAADSFDTANTQTQTVPGTGNDQATIAVTLTNFDAGAIGDAILLLVSRDVGADSVVGDVQLGDAYLEYTGA